MNERAKDLALDAIVKHISSDAWVFTDAELEQFAQSIINDCTTICDEIKAQYFASRKSTMDFDEKNIYAEGEAACDVLKYKMKRHFGVNK